MHIAAPTYSDRVDDFPVVVMNFGRDGVPPHLTSPAGPGSSA
jgi:hypothetical protein